ncbi:MAG: hypothetical protein Q7K43_06150 [Candidatus Woesearchaeota archaeon]|nr:hypothetical protein [Candidatus Woesearchaeota archaeon]
MWFSNKETEEKIAVLDSNVTQSFYRVKIDMDTLRQWVDYLNQQNQGQTQLITELRRQIEQIPKTRQDIKLLVDSVYDYDGIKERIRLTEQKIIQMELQRSKIEQIDQKFQDLPQQLRTIRAQIELIHEEKIHEAKTRELHEVQTQKQYRPTTDTDSINQRQPVSRFKEKVLKKLTQNSKEYVKGLILSHIHKYGKISGQQLRESIVDEQGLCSKSSFYRLLEEIEKEEQLTVLAEGKNKIYFTEKKHG